jgi:hypothetical protein
MVHLRQAACRGQQPSLAEHGVAAIPLVVVVNHCHERAGAAAIELARIAVVDVHANRHRGPRTYRRVAPARRRPGRAKQAIAVVGIADPAAVRAVTQVGLDLLAEMATQITTRLMPFRWSSESW